MTHSWGEDTPKERVKALKEYVGKKNRDSRKRRDCVASRSMEKGSLRLTRSKRYSRD